MEIMETCVKETKAGMKNVHYYEGVWLRQTFPSHDQQDDLFQVSLLKQGEDHLEVEWLRLRAEADAQATSFSSGPTRHYSCRGFSVDKMATNTCDGRREHASLANSPTCDI